MLAAARGKVCQPRFHIQVALNTAFILKKSDTGPHLSDLYELCQNRGWLSDPLLSREQ